MKTRLVVGGGFAGLVASVGAARELDALGIASGEAKVTLINREPFTCIRPRNYDRDLSEVRLALDDVLEPAGMDRMEGEVSAVDAPRRSVRIKAGRSSERTHEYDLLVLAAGSRLHESDIPGLREFTFNVDSYDGAARLNEHIASLPTASASPGQYTVLVVGAGLTGLETACEMPAKLRDAIAGAGVDSAPLRTILADHAAMSVPTWATARGR